MELHQLRYFLSLAHELHFLRAAAREHVTQPTLSQQIIKLEKELGVSLFERTPRHVHLTPEGQLFMPHAVAILEEVKRATEELKTSSKDISGRVLLGAIPTMAPYILPLVAARLRKQAPHLKLELQELPTADLLRYLKEGRIDLALLSLPITEPNITTQTLGEEPFYVAVSRKHPLASKRRISPSALESEKLLILQEGHCFREQSLEFCHRSHVDPQVIFQGSSLTSVLRMAASGEGITFVPHMAAQAKENPGLKFIPFEEPHPTRKIAAAWRASLPPRRAEATVLKILQEAVTQTTPRPH